MKNLPNNLRLLLDENYYICKIVAQKKLESKIDDTVKYLFRLDDGNFIESVIMYYNHGTSICISTQVGCRMNCDFCATGKMGLIRNLTPSEMLAQIEYASKDLGIRISHVVLMGMGEPLDNYENVIKFLKLVNNKDGLNIGMRHISLSTCGLADKIYDLANENFQLTLSVSLHASNNQLRSKIMPINKKWPIEDLLKACRDYIKKTGRRISFEYALINKFNDTKECADELADKLKTMACHVNLIPVNLINDVTYLKSENKRQEKFKLFLQNHGINVTIRKTLGFDINASCGQLKANLYKGGTVLKYYGKSDIGQLRDTNQDAFSYSYLDDGSIWAIVCDGMGGSNGGDFASENAVAIISKRIKEQYQDGISADNVKNIMESLVLAANAEIYEISKHKPNLNGMGTTMVLCFVIEMTAYIAYVGDSRAYKIDKNSIIQLTKDHSVVQLMLDKGEITQEQAFNHPRRHFLTRAIGVEHSVIVDFIEIPLKNDDVIILCTDGLTNYLRANDISNIVNQNESSQIPDKLINSANDLGGSDNITVVCISQ